MNRWESDDRIISLRQKFGARIVVSIDMKSDVVNHYGPLFNPDAEPEQVHPSSFDSDFDIQTIEAELESGPCLKVVRCACGRRFGCCSEIEQILIKENQSMINYTSNNQPSTKTRPDSKGIPFLKADDLGPKPLQTEIMGAKISPDTFKGNEGSEVVTVKVKIGGSVIRLWTLRTNNPNLGTLCDGLGKDETKWKGSLIELYTEKDEFDEKLWIRSSLVKGRK